MSSSCVLGNNRCNNVLFNVPTIDNNSCDDNNCSKHFACKFAYVVRPETWSAHFYPHKMLPDQMNSSSSLFFHNLTSLQFLGSLLWWKFFNCNGMYTHFWRRFRISSATHTARPRYACYTYLWEIKYNLPVWWPHIHLCTNSFLYTTKINLKGEQCITNALLL